MSSRTSLQNELTELLESNNVYFQPPASVQMRYPAIRYKFEGLRNTHANDRVYKRMGRYQLTLIDKDPESKFVDRILAIPYCTLVQTYRADNFNHFVFELYY